jgi:hypothetical protein
VLKFVVDAFNAVNSVSDTAYVRTPTSPLFGQAISARIPRVAFSFCAGQGLDVWFA